MSIVEKTLMVLCLASTVVLTCYVVAEGQTRRDYIRPVAAGCIGRYQVSGNIRIDTVTGRTWEAKRVLLDCALAGVAGQDATHRLGWYEFIVAPRVRPVPLVVPQRAPAVRPRIVPMPLQSLPTY